MHCIQLCNINNAKVHKIKLYGKYYCFHVRLALKEYGTRALSCVNIWKLKIQIIIQE